LQRCRRIQEDGVPRDRTRIIVNHDGKPRPHRFSIGVENQHIEQRVIGLPDGIGAFGTMAVDEFVSVTKSRRSVLRQRDHCRTQMPHNPVNAAIGRWRPVVLRGERCHAPMHGGNGRTRFT